MRATHTSGVPGVAAQHRSRGATAASKPRLRSRALLAGGLGAGSLVAPGLGGAALAVAAVAVAIDAAARAMPSAGGMRDWRQ